MPAHIAYHWHHHDDEDEFFYVVSGRLRIDLEDETIELGPNQGHTVPRKVVHRTRARAHSHADGRGRWRRAHGLSGLTGF